MIGDVLRGLKRAFVFEICGDAGGAESVIANPGLDAGAGRAALNHPVGVLLPTRSPLWFRWPVRPAAPWHP